MKVTLNGKTKEVIPLSRLTFDQFNEFVVKAKRLDLPSYLALFFEYTEQQMKEAKIESLSLPAVYSALFDVDIEAMIKTQKKTVTVGDNVHFVENLSMDTFGKTYYFELKRQTAKDTDVYDLAVYALALAVSDTDADTIDATYKALKARRWTDILPQAFFFLKRIKIQKKIDHLSLNPCIWELKKARFKIALYLKELQQQEKKEVRKSYAAI